MFDYTLTSVLFTVFDVPAFFSKPSTERALYMLLKPLFLGLSFISYYFLLGVLFTQVLVYVRFSYTGKDIRLIRWIAYVDPINWFFQLPLFRKGTQVRAAFLISVNILINGLVILTLIAWNNIREDWWCYVEWYNPYVTSEYCGYKSRDVPLGTFNYAEVNFICTQPGIDCDQELPTSALELSVINFGILTLIISIVAYLVIAFSNDQPISHNELY